MRKDAHRSAYDAVASRLALGLSMVTIVVFILPGVLLMAIIPPTLYFMEARILESARTPLRVGGETIYGEYMHGAIDAYRIDHRAETIDESRRDMHSPVWGLHPSVGLVAAYGFEEGAGSASAVSIPL